MNNDLISRSGLINTLNEGLSLLKQNRAVSEGFIEQSLYGLAISDAEATIALVAFVPAVDAVEVVRCEKCVFKQAPKKYGDLMCGMLKVPMKSNDFCSHGERMADNA